MNGTTGENAYTIIETLHKSRQFCVYKAKNYFSGKFVTIKTTEQRWKAEPLFVKQLRSEAETGLRLKHPNIRETIGIFEDSGTFYMVCEYIEGDPLNVILSSPKVEISFENARKWTLQLLDTLEYAHAQKTMHLNVNPSNIIVTPEYNLKLFGFGKSSDIWKSADPERNEFHPVLFTAPEVFTIGAPDLRSDIYSVGVLSYLLFCGKLPWTLDQRESPSQQKMHTFQRPSVNPELLGKRVPHWLFNILNKALMLDPAKRFSTVAELRSAIITQQEIPFESCLTRAVPEKPITVVKQESLPEKRETEKTVEQVKTSATNLPEQQKQETTVLETQSEQATTPISVSQQTAENPAPVRYQTAVPQQIPITAPYKKVIPPKPSIDPEQKRELTKMQHLFRYFGIASLLILSYIVVKYVIISDNPRFSKVDKEELASADDQEFKIANKPLQMISVPGDSTVIGYMAPFSEDDEFPPREVTVPSFSISPKEITCAQWSMAFPDYVVEDKDDNLPMTDVSFNEVLEFCNEKSRLDGLKPCYDFSGTDVECDFTVTGYRLPTEAEWEFAAKEGKRDVLTLYSGSNTPDDVGWYDANSDGKLHPGGKKQPNSLGIYDMSGNVSEWVWNWYTSYSSAGGARFAGADSGIDKVIRGGSWKQPAKEMRVTNRDAVKPYLKADYIGFRVVRTK